MTSVGGLIERVRGLGQDRLDALMALGLLLGSAVELAVQLDHSRRPVLTMVLLLALCAGLAVRRRWPVALATGALLCVLAFERFAEVSDWMLPSLAVLAYMYTVGAHVSGRRGQVAAVGLTTLAVAVIALDPAGSKQSAANDLVTAMMFVVIPIAVGRTLAARRALTRELRDKAARLQREREDQAREAAIAERMRVARELHDVVAHSVSVMVIQAQAARRVAATDRDGARRALGVVESSGRDALAEMRRMVGVLRRGDAALAASDAPGLAQVPALADRARAAGLPVELHVEGHAHPLPPGLDLAAYRVVQEALTNVVKHAGPARACVTMRYAEEELWLEISDTGRGLASEPADGGGHGLVGMRERLGLYGGELSVGCPHQGGFAVQARIPLAGVTA
jgi:signal transduction histidine kinase